MKYLAILLPVAAWALSACDNIESNERWEEKVPVEIKKNVLIEDFTGQDCINSPAAADFIHQLQQGRDGKLGFLILLRDELDHFSRAPDGFSVL